MEMEENNQPLKHLYTMYDKAFDSVGNPAVLRDGMKCCNVATQPEKKACHTDNLELRKLDGGS